MSRRGRVPLPGRELLASLGGRVPGDSCAQAAVTDYMAPLAGAGPRLLDLGCGRGESVDAFRALRPDVDWLGVDLAESVTVAERTRTDARFETFDGVVLPLPDACLDGVLCRQVLEHVERPAELLAEVVRVLRPGGVLAGSTSQLEPYHEASTQNFTPYGLARLLERVGLRVDELRPGMDGITLTLRRGLGRAGWFDRYWVRESPLNRMIALAGRAAGASAQRVNAAKLVFAGQFCFLAVKPGGPR